MLENGLKRRTDDLLESQGQLKDLADKLDRLADVEKTCSQLANEMKDKQAENEQLNRQIEQEK